MFDLGCVLLVALMAKFSQPQYRAAAFFVLTEFALHGLAALFGLYLTDWLNPVGIYLVYILIELTILYMLATIQAHLFIMSLIFINLVYNVLTISQFVMPTYDFYSLYPTVTKTIMALEVLYLAGLTGYVANYRRKRGITNTDHFDKLFCVRRRFNNRHLL